MTSKTAHNRKGFFINIVLPSAFAVILFVVTLFFIVIPSFENGMMDRKREMIKELTNAATSILEKYHRDEVDSLLSRKEAQEIAISRIQYLRYGDENKDYFWITDTVPVMIMHPWVPSLNGQDLSHYADPHGKRLFVESVRITRDSGHGYMDYMWQWKDDSTHIVPKLSYVKAFKPWGWIIGTGIYIEDVKKEINSLTQKFVRISIIISCITALILFYIGRQSFRIEGKRQKAEEELNESREKYKSLVEASTEGLLMLMDGRVTFTNSILQKMTGLTDEVLQQTPLEKIVEIPDAVKEKMALNPSQISVEPFETHLMSPSGERLSVLLGISPVVFNGRDALIFSLKDLSYNEQIKEELYHSREKFKVLMDKLNIGLFRTTLDLKGRFLEANETTLRILGYKNIGELENTYILELFVDLEDKKSFRNLLLENGFLKNQVLKLRRQNGQLTVVSLSLVVVEDNKTPRFCDGIIEDITYQRKDNLLSDHLVSDYATYGQLFYQTLEKVSRPALCLKYTEKVGDASRKMIDAGCDAAFVEAETGEVLGIVTGRDLRERAFTVPEFWDKRVFEIMTAPVVAMNRERMVFEAIRVLEKKKINHLMVADNEGRCIGMVDLRSLSSLLYAFPPLSYLAMDGETSMSSLIDQRKKYISSLLALIENSNNPGVIFQGLAALSDEITKKIVEIVTMEMGRPPVDYCFVSLGSDARREQTLSTDQDNALIYVDVEEPEQKAVSEYFTEFGRKVCTGLNEVGYSFCKGDVMAMNPAWCQPLSVWKSYFRKWINKGTAKDLLDINIFFDLRSIYGNNELVNDLQNHIFDLTAKNPAYLYHLTQNTLVLKPQVGFWGNILIETAGAPPETVNIKESIMPIVNYARIYALKNHFQAASTSSRLQLMLERNILQESSYTNIIQAFDYLNMMRLKHQAFLLRSNLKPDNLINTRVLSELDKTIIKKVISNINTMLSKLSFDFKGTL